MTNKRRTRSGTGYGPSKVAGVLSELEVPTKTDEEWSAHDIEVAQRRQAERAKEQRKALGARGAALRDCGAPVRLVELVVSGKIRKDSEVMRDVAQWAKSDSRILILSGGVGVGKTVAAIRWLANHGGNRPCFVRASDFEALGRYSTKWRETWHNATGMVLDDMGAEYMDAKGNLLSDLDTLVDVFSEGSGRLIMTTNMPWEDWQIRYEERITSRILGSGTVVKVVGQDMRRL